MTAAPAAAVETAAEAAADAVKSPNVLLAAALVIAAAVGVAWLVRRFGRELIARDADYAAELAAPDWEESDEDEAA